MKITKLGHCCLLIEEGSLRILTDPGAWSTRQLEVRNVDIILITHEHQDHVHIDSLKTVLQQNPNARIITNKGVGVLLSTAGIAFQTIEDQEKEQISNVLLEGFGNEHALIYGEFGKVQNTGYFINNRFFYPGDAFYNPGKKVEILALPVAGPWMKISEAIDYAKLLRPQHAFPVHDGMLKFGGPFHSVPQRLLGEEGISFDIIEEGETREF